MSARGAGTRPLVMPGLLPWQVFFGAAMLGMLMLRQPHAAIAGGLALCALGAFPKRFWVRVCALALFFCAGWGVGLYVAPAPPPDVPVWMQARERVRVTGVVDEVQRSPRGAVRMFLRGATCRRDTGETVSVPGRFLWNWQDPAADPRVGMRVSVTTRARPARGYVNPGNWNTAFYWAQRGVYWRGWTRGMRGDPDLSGQVSEGLRHRIVTAVAGDGPMTQGRAMLTALLTGDRFFLQSPTFDVMRQASLAHSLALSGMHLGFAAGLGVGAAWLVGLVAPGVYLRVPRPKLAVLLAAPCVAGYVWLGGGSPSLVRAAIMFAAWGALLLLNRERVLVDGLFVALVCILAMDPLAVYDLRLQLSAVAVAGIGLFAPALWHAAKLCAAHVARRFRRPQLQHDGGHRAPLWERTLRGGAVVLLMSASTNIALLPLIVINFGCVAAGLHMNVLWLPLLGLVVMPLGLCGMALLAAPWTAPFGHLGLNVAAGVLDAGLAVLHMLADGGMLPEVAALRPLWPQMFGYALAVAAVGLALARARRRAMWAALLGVMLLTGPGLVRGVMQGQDRVRLTMLDTGQSQAVCVDAPGGVRVLLDAGGSLPGFDLGRAVVGPALANGRPPRLDIAVLTHPDADHYRGYPFLLRRFMMGRFAGNGDWPGNIEVQRLRGDVRAAGLTPEAWHAGQRILLTPDLWLEVLGPPAQGTPERATLGKNDASLVVRLVWKGRGLALVPGDVEEAGIARVLASGRDVRADVLVLPHHGSKSSFAPALYDAVRPRLALASAGFINYRRYPNRVVRRAVAERHIPLFTPGWDGATRVTWAGPDAPPVVETSDNPRRQWRKASLTRRAENPVP